jgi:hypothetical protein
VKLRRRNDEDEHLVARAMRELAQETAVDRPLPDPSFIWWKAQLLRRFEAEREVTAPLEIGDRFHIGAAVLGAVALAGGVWDQLPRLSFTSAEVLGVTLGAVVLLSVLAIAAIDVIRER